VGIVNFKQCMVYGDHMAVAGEALNPRTSHLSYLAKGCYWNSGVYIYSRIHGNGCLITSHIPFSGAWSSTATPPPQIAGHAHDIRYRTKHPIDLQATPCSRQPTLPIPVHLTKRSHSLTLPFLRLNVTKTLCFRTGWGVGMRNTKLRRSFSVRIQHVISLRRSLTGPGRDVSWRMKKNEGSRYDG